MCGVQWWVLRFLPDADAHWQLAKNLVKRQHLLFKSWRVTPARRYLRSMTLVSVWSAIFSLLARSDFANVWRPKIIFTLAESRENNIRVCFIACCVNFEFSFQYLHRNAGEWKFNAFYFDKLAGGKFTMRVFMHKRLVYFW